MARKINRKYYNGQHYFVDEVNKVVKLLPEFHEQLLNKQLWGGRGFKKVGGSSLGDVIVTDNYKSQFMAFCRIADLALPVLDEKYVAAGRVIEPKVIEVVESLVQEKIKTFPGSEYNWDLFPEVEVVGGLPDGYIESKNLIIEIKTAGRKKHDKWIEDAKIRKLNPKHEHSIPKHYQLQGQLYAFLKGAKQFWIVSVPLDESDYANPHEYSVKKSEIAKFSLPVNEQEIKEVINKVRVWYKQHTETGVSPEFDLIRDADQLEWLKCSSPEEWEKLKEKWIKSNKLVL